MIERKKKVGNIKESKEGNKRTFQNKEVYYFPLVILLI